MASLLLATVVDRAPMSVTDKIEFLGVVATGIGLIVGAVSLVREFRWRRRQYAVDMMRDWSKNTAPHRDAIEREYPELFDAREGVERRRLSEPEAEGLFSPRKGDDHTAEIKRHFIELLNYCEFIAVSYHHRVSNRSIIEGSFKGAALLLHDRLHPYIDVSTNHRGGRNPWSPFCNLMDKWSSTGIAPQHQPSEKVGVLRRGKRRQKPARSAN